MKQVVSEGIVAVVAGSDTVSSALTSIFFCLTAHPEAYKRLQDEIDRFYPPAQDPCDTQYHREMYYLSAVMYVHVAYEYLTRLIGIIATKPFASIHPPLAEANVRFLVVAMVPS